MSYAWITFAQARAQLAALLSDTTNTYWADAELGVYLVEALRMWGGLTRFWSDRGVFPTVVGTEFYDLTSALPALLGRNVTDTQLVSEIQYHLLEPANGSSWTGTNQFTLADATQALERRRNQFLIETGAVITHASLAVPASPIGRVSLPDSVISLRRLGWTTPEGYKSFIWKSDEWAMASYRQAWNLDPGSPPTAWSMALASPLTVQLASPPSDSGTLDYLSANAGAALDPTAGVPIGIPDDFAWVVKFGALSDMLNKDGPGRDVSRAEYCDQRYREGCTIAANASSLMQARINDQILYSDSLAEVDAARSNWQNQRRTPDNASMAGLNVMVLANVPDAIYSITADVVRNAVVPAVDGDFIQLGREDFDGVLGEAQHLACFKLGGADFAASMPLHDRFMRMASVYNDTVRALVRFESPLEDRAQREENFNPMRRKREVMA